MKLQSHSKSILGPVIKLCKYRDPPKNPTEDVGNRLQGPAQSESSSSKYSSALLCVRTTPETQEMGTINHTNTAVILQLEFNGIVSVHHFVPPQMIMEINSTTIYFGKYLKVVWWDEAEPL